jgi:copper(I)-binding protein
MRKLLLATFLVLAFPPAVATFPTASIAAEQAPVVAGDLEITAYRVKAMLPGQPAGGGFLTIANKGQAADRLTAVTSPSAGVVEIHTMDVVNDVMTMRPVEGGLEIPAGAMVELRPGGQHLMFMSVKEPFKEGDTVPVTLEFEKAGKVEIEFPIVGLGG